MSLSLIVPGVLAIIFGILMIFQKNLYASAVCLLMVFLQMAAFFFLFGAQLLGWIQILVYAGAIMVLIVVAIMAASPPLESLWAHLKISPIWTGAILGIGLIETTILWRLEAGAGLSIGMLGVGLERKMAAFLFGPYALMTEAIGILIFISAISVLQD